MRGRVEQALRAATSRGRRPRPRGCRAGAPRRTDRCRIPRSGSRSGSRRNPPAASRWSGRRTFHSSGSRKVTMVRSPLGSTMTAEIGVTRPGMCTRCLVVDALMRELFEDEAARCFAGVAHRPADRGAAAEPHDSDRGIERVAAADLVEMGGVLLGAARRNAADAKRQVAHRHADAEDTRRDFRRGSVKIHRGIRHAGSAFCRNQCPG